MQKSTPLKKVGKKIKALRMAMKLSRERFSKDCFVKPVQMARIERGEVNLRFATLVRIAFTLNMDLHELLK